MKSGIMVSNDGIIDTANEWGSLIRLPSDMVGGEEDHRSLSDIRSHPDFGMDVGGGGGSLVSVGSFRSVEHDFFGVRGGSDVSERTILMHPLPKSRPTTPPPTRPTSLQQETDTRTTLTDTERQSYPSFQNHPAHPSYPHRRRTIPYHERDE